MLASPARPEVDHRTIKLVVGVVALSLATLTDLFAKTPIASISASYYKGGWIANRKPMKMLCEHPALAGDGAGELPLRRPVDGHARRAPAAASTAR